MPPATPTCISPGSPLPISLILVFHLGAVALEVGLGVPHLKQQCILLCPLGSWVVVVTVVVVIVVAVVVVIVVAVVVVCSRRPAPTVPGQVTKFPAVSAFRCTRTVMVEVTLGTSRFSPFIRFPVTIPGSISPACILPFVLLVLVISRSIFQPPLVFCLPLSQSVNPPFQSRPCSIFNGNPHGLCFDATTLEINWVGHPTDISFNFCQHLSGTTCTTDNAKLLES
ncbi:hypothetical protein Tco_1103981 [Tanacetum coccineum]